MEHARHHTAQPHARLSGGNVGRAPCISQPVLDAIKATWAKGANSQEIAVAAGLTRRAVNEACCNMRSRTGLIYSLGGAKRHHVRHFWHEVPREQAEAYMAQVEAERAAAVLAAEKASRIRYKASARAKKKGDTEALAAIQAEMKRRAEERAEARRKKELEVEAARQKRRTSTATKRATQAINALADKYRGKLSPSPESDGLTKKKQVTIVWPESVKVQQCKPWQPRFADLQPSGVISGQIGQYDTEASNWALQVAA